MKCKNCGRLLVKCYDITIRFFHLEKSRNADYSNRTRKDLWTDKGYDYNGIIGFLCTKPEPEVRKE